MNSADIKAAVEILNGVEQLNAKIHKLEKDNEALHRVVKFITTDYIELSHDKIEWQRNDWRKRCEKAIEEIRGFKCPLNDPECKENCGSYGCGN